MGDLQGVFTFSRDLATHLTRDKWKPTGRVLWRVYEKHTGDNSFRLVQTFEPEPQEGRSGTWTYRNTRMELDGEVIIRATGRDSGKRIAVRGVKLNHVDVLPEHIQVALLMCIRRMTELVNIGHLFNSIARVFLLLTTKFNWSSILSIISGGRSSAHLAGLTDLEIEILESCADYNDNWRWYRLEYEEWHGYGRYADDIAELTVGWKDGQYPTSEGTCIPVRRRHGVTPVDACSHL